MIVENDDREARRLEEMLASMRYRTLVMRSGREAMELALRDPPDLMLLEVHLPGIDGLWTADRLKRSRRTMMIPIILMCSEREPCDRARAMATGAEEVITRPVKKYLLEIRIKSLLRAKQYHDHLERSRRELEERLAGKDQEMAGILSSLSRFIPQEFLRLLGRGSIRDVELGDHVLRDMTIMFSDIRSFTAISEKMTPEENFKFLNAYLERMNPFIWNNRGFVDKYIGDGIMALFPYGVETGLAAAVEMLRYLPVYNTQRRSFGYDPLRIGVGIHTGPVMLGMIGHRNLMQGTVISDAVNIAARLESLTKRYRVSLIVSGQVIQGLGKKMTARYRYLDTIKVKGKDRPVTIYEVFEGDPPDLISLKMRTRPLFERGVRAFVEGDVKGALALFYQLWQSGSGDYTVAYYINRCSYYVRYGITQNRKPDEP
jgi:two-component system sensor histidine kinase ChiS